MPRSKSWPRKVRSSESPPSSSSIFDRYVLVSLISHLRDSKSPVHTWFERNLAGTRPVVAAANDQLCSTPRQPCLIERPVGSDAALVGIAADYLVRAVMRPGALEETVATRGAYAAAPPVGIRLEREAVQMINQLRPWETQPAGDALRELCRLCLVLARFDQAVRAAPMIKASQASPRRRQRRRAGLTRARCRPRCRGSTTPG